MEKLNPNSQSKVEIEKAPLENEGLLDAKEKESNKKENITFEINGQPIEAVKYYFEYPEKIQKETGILGYERTKISNENISDFIKKFYLDKHDINIEDYGFKGVEHIGDFDRINQTRRDSKRNSNLRFSDEYLKSEQYKIDEKIQKINEDILRDFVYSLSNGEYPNKSFVHVMGADHERNGTKQEEYRNRFVNDKFFLQKIYDLEYIKDQHYLGEEKIFDMANVFGGYESKSHITIFDSETGNKISPGDYIQIKDMGDQNYYDGIKNRKMFACTPDSGLNIETGDAYFRHRFTFDNKNPFFGFPMDENSLFYKYLHQALNIYVNKLKGLDLKKLRSSGSGVSAILQEIILSNSSIQELLFEDFKGKQVMSDIDEKPEEYQNKMKLKIKEILTDVENKIGVNITNDLVDSDEIIRKIFYNNFSGNYELRLPIFIGSNDILQLSWGHAKHAHYMNEKGFNFFKFKHLDHLPNSEDVNSSES